MMIEVTAAIIEQEGKVLLARRKVGQHLAGFWEFPGGKIEKNESPQACLKRELQEEFDVETKIHDFVTESIFDYPNKTVKLMAFRVQLMGGDFALHAHDEICWVLPSQLMDYKLAPADIPIAQDYFDSIKNK